MNISELKTRWELAYIDQSTMVEEREMLCEILAEELDITLDEAEVILSDEV